MESSPLNYMAKNIDVHRENDAELDILAEAGAEFYVYEMDITMHKIGKTKEVPSEQI